MVSINEIETQLRDIGVKVRYWGAQELHELPHIITPGEKIVGYIHGRYEGGFATLVATDQRLLIVDKKPFYLTTNDIRYEVIAEVDLHSRLFDTSIKILTINKSLVFRSIRKQKMRDVIAYIQQKAMELRNQQTPQQPSFGEAALAADARLVIDSARSMYRPRMSLNPYATGLTMRRGYVPKR